MTLVSNNKVFVIVYKLISDNRFLVTFFDIGFGFTNIEKPLTILITYPPWYILLTR
jgi:hypothetical protein